MNAPEPAPRGKYPVIFDLDGTLSEETWPSNHVGEKIDEGVELLLHYSSEGYPIKIHTARPRSHEGRIWRWLEELGLQNVVVDVVCGKPEACLYVDDRGFRPDFLDAREAPEPAPVVTLVDDTGEDHEAWEPDEEENADAAPDADDPERWTVMD